MKTLRLSKDLDVPADIATEAVAMIGARGSGKTTAAGRLFEELYEAEVQTIWLDPVGVAYGLRLARDGKGAGIQVPIFGGLHGDVPLEPTGGELIADVVVDKNTSAVLDVSQFNTDADKARFIAGFSERLFQRKKREPSVVEMIIDEGQEFLPQNPQPGEQMMLHRLIRQIKIGRNFGMGVCIISPRPQEINKKALNGCQTVLAFRLTGAHERKAMKEWIAAHDLDQSVIEGLPSLETGTCHVWSPAFLKVNRQIRILPKRTFDASATPKVGEHRAARTLAPIDLEHLREAMKATIEKAKENDPKALRERIKLLEGRAATQEKLPISIYKDKVVEKIVEKPILRAGELDRLEKLAGRAEKLLDKALLSQKEQGEIATKLKAILNDARRPIEKAAAAPAPYKHVYVGHSGGSTTGHRKTYDVPVTGEKLAPAHQRVLNAVAWLRERGVAEPPRAQVAVLAGFTPGSGYFERVVGELKTAGLLTYPQGGLLTLTEDGAAKSDAGEAHQTSEAIQADVLRRVGPAHQKILQAAIVAHPGDLARSDMAVAVGMAPGSGYFERVVGELKTMGVMTYPDKGRVRASDILFVETTKL